MRQHLARVVALLLISSASSLAQQAPPSAKPVELDFTMPPKQFRETLERELKIYRQKQDGLYPKPPKAVAMLLDAPAGGIKAGKRTVVAGEFLLDSDGFKTPDDGSVRLGFRTGDQLLIAPRTEVRLHDVDEADRISNPILDLLSGEARVLVKALEPSSKPPPGTLTFVVRTTQGFFAATGTDYIVYVKPDFLSCYTLTGTVRYGKELSAVRNGGKEIAAGHFATMAPPDPFLREPRRFETGAYLKAFSQRLPELRKLWVKADQDTKEGKLRQKFLRADELRAKPRVPSVFARPKEAGVAK